MENGSFKIKKDLGGMDTFIIENSSRMIYIYRKKQGKSLDEAFILEDNIDYFFYIAMKGPLTIQFFG
jgi:hypothetical protein